MNGKTKMKVSISVSKSAVPPGPAARSAALTSLASTSVPRAYVHIRIEVLVANERSGGDAIHGDNHVLIASTLHGTNCE
jgi:hypothetical protein